MNILDVQRVTNRARTCTEDQIVSIAIWFKRRYELMFVEAWGFKLLPANPEVPGIGERISRNSGDYIINLEKYHKIKVNMIENIDFSQAMQIIKNELAAGLPPVIRMDSFWVPWDRVSYQKSHSGHVFAIVGNDEEKAIFYVADAIKDQNILICPVDHFEKGGLPYYVMTFSLVGEDVQEVDWVSIIENAVNRLYPPGSLSSFDEIRELAKLVLESLDLQLEFPEGENVWWTSMFYNVEGVLKGRRLFSEVLKCLGDLSGVKELLVYADKFEHLASKWNITLSLLIKESMLAKTEKFAEKIAGRLRELADEEEKIAEELLALTRQSSVLAKESLGAKEGFADQMKWKATYLDISPYCNNRAFESSEPGGMAPDFTGLGDYLLKDKIPPTPIWQVQEMEFHFPWGGGSGFDNISCKGQTIDVPEGSYASIMFLGAAEMGHYADRVILNFADGEPAEITLGFSNWGYNQPLYDEVIAWKGYGITKIPQEWKVERSLYALRRPVNAEKRLVSVTLPDCQNLHIFAISLGVKDEIISSGEES